MNTILQIHFYAVKLCNKFVTLHNYTVNMNIILFLCIKNSCCENWQKTCILSKKQAFYMKFAINISAS